MAKKTKKSKSKSKRQYRGDRAHHGSSINKINIKIGAPAPYGGGSSVSNAVVPDFSGIIAALTSRPQPFQTPPTANPPSAFQQPQTIQQPARINTGVRDILSGQVRETSRGFNALVPSLNSPSPMSVVPSPRQEIPSYSPTPVRTVSSTPQTAPAHIPMDTGRGRQRSPQIPDYSPSPSPARGNSLTPMRQQADLPSATGIEYNPSRFYVEEPTSPEAGPDLLRDRAHHEPTRIPVNEAAPQPPSSRPPIPTINSPPSTAQLTEALHRPEGNNPTEVVPFNPPASAPVPTANPPVRVEIHPRFNQLFENSPGSSNGLTELRDLAEQLDESYSSPRDLTHPISPNSSINRALSRVVNQTLVGAMNRQARAPPTIEELAPKRQRTTEDNAPSSNPVQMGQPALQRRPVRPIRSIPSSILG